MKQKQRFFILSFLLVFPLLLYSIPGVKERVDWRIIEWRSRMQYFLFPPEHLVFEPNAQVIASPTGVVAIERWTPIATDIPNRPTSTLTFEPMISVLPIITPIPTSLPSIVQLSGIQYERQGWNNCGPATLAMALSYWGWDGDQYQIAPYAKPNDRDKNVMPYEMMEYVNERTDLRAISRLAGDLNLLKRFIAAGFPVVIEKGFEGADFDGWMGHYALVTGNDDTLGTFITEDSYMGSGLQLSYEVVETNWRAFNETFILVYPVDREPEVLTLLGDHAQEAYNREYAARKALAESGQLSGRDQYFALFNRGSSLVALLDYADAAQAYDKAFELYRSLPAKERPWRMMWYQTGPYWAYYYTGRYQDVVDLASQTLSNMSEPVLEESYYWRGLSFAAMGSLDKAIEDLQTSRKVHPNFAPAVDQLRLLGVEVNTNR